MTTLKSIPNNSGFIYISSLLYCELWIGFLNKLIYSKCALLISTWLSWLSWRYNIFICVKLLNFIGSYDKKLPDKSSFIKPVHFVTIDNSVCFIFVPARINNFRDAGSLINELICSYYYWVCFFFIAIFYALL